MRSAAPIRSQCRSDYKAHCASVPPGGEASLQCLQKNMSSLSRGCQAAVRAVEPPAAPKAEAAPAAPKAESAPAATPKHGDRPGRENRAAREALPPLQRLRLPRPRPARRPTSRPAAQISAIRSACRSDYPKVCAAYRPGAPRRCNAWKRTRQKSRRVARRRSAASGGAGAPRQAAQPRRRRPRRQQPRRGTRGARIMVLRPMRRREEFFVLRSACGADVRAFAAALPAGGGRIVQCLATQAASLSPACKDVLGQFAARMRLRYRGVLAVALIRPVSRGNFCSGGAICRRD